MIANSWGTRRAKSRFAPKSEINVTPFVDVMLVLLIIFMVAAPLMTVTVPVDLAKTDAAPKQEADPLTVAITSDGRVFLQDAEVGLEELVPAISRMAEGGTDQRIHLRGDRGVNYERVIQVMTLIDQAGFNRIGLVGSVSQPQ